MGAINRRTGCDTDASHSQFHPMPCKLDASNTGAAMALMISRAKRSLGAFLLSALLYLFPSLSGCGAEDYGGADGAYGPPACTSREDCEDRNDGLWYCDQSTKQCKPRERCASDQDCRRAVGPLSTCTNDPYRWPVYGCTTEADAGTADGGTGNDGGQD